MATLLHCLDNMASVITGSFKVLGLTFLKVPFTIVGFVAVAAAVFHLAHGVLRAMHHYFIPRYLLRLGVDFQKIEGWAVVTGATDGIGKQFVLQLAALGKDIVLVARNPQKMQDVIREIKEQSPNVKTKFIIADFKDADKLEFFERIRRELGSLDIGILINNVGIMVDSFLPFLDSKLQLDLDQMHVNVNSTVFMTRMILPGMLKRGKSKPSVLINLASTAGVMDPPMQYLDLYPSTKAFLRYFTKALALEYESSGVTIQCVSPGLVRTNMSSTFAKNWLRFGLYITGVGVQSYVRWTLTNVGIKSETFGHWTHALQMHVFSWMPDWVPSSIMGRLSMLAQNFAQGSGTQEAKRK